MSQGQQQIEGHSAKTGERGMKQTRKRRANDDTPLIDHIIAAMKEYKAITIKIAEELGFEHRGEPSSDEVKRYLLDIPMDPDDYALLHQIGGKPTLCHAILEAVGAADHEIEEASGLAAFAYDAIGV